jgi:hypothetical protein
MHESQRRAIAAHRERLAERGLTRYEVRGLERDKDLVRNLARRLAVNDAGAERLRAKVYREIGGKPQRRGSVWEALRRSPAVGADLDLTRSVVTERDSDQ